MNENKSISSTTTLSLGTMGFVTFIVFLILKLTHTWDVNWFWVWFPLWAPAALGFLILIIALIVLFFATRAERRGR